MPVLPIDGVSTATGVPKLLEGAKLAFTLALRQAFSSSLTSVDLRYNSNKVLTKIQIFSAHPKKLEFYPALVVSVGSGDCSFKYLQDDLVEESDELQKVTYAGQLSFNMGITVMSNSTLERERIVDHLIFFIRHIFADVFRRFRSEAFKFDLVYTKDIRLGSENIVEVENKPVYEQTLNIPVYLEYKAVIDQQTLETLRIINIDDVDVNLVVAGQ